MTVAPGFDAIQAARARIAGRVRRTPVLVSEALDAELGAALFFKCENLQLTGAFKARGAFNAVLSLPPEQAARGVATHSSGNHGAALALAARSCGIAAYVVAPRTTPASKQHNMLRYGARLQLCEPTLAARQRAAEEIVATTGASLIHPYDNAAVMAGQGTVALELLEQAPDLEVIVCPIGGGGLISGVAVAAHGIDARIVVLGAEPAGIQGLGVRQMQQQHLQLHRFERIGQRIPQAKGAQAGSDHGQSLTVGAEHADQVGPPGLDFIQQREPRAVREPFTGHHGLERLPVPQQLQGQGLARRDGQRLPAADPDQAVLQHRPIVIHQQCSE